MKSGFKHLVTCRCVLPQFKRAPNAPAHQFVVFSIIDEGLVTPKFAQCNNCGVIHKVIDVCRSDIVPRESMGSMATIDDIKLSLPPQLVALLDVNNVDLASWESAQFIIENSRWGEFVVLSTDVVDGVRNGKYVRILGQNMFRVESFTREEVLG